MQSVLQDIRFEMRQLLRKPGFTAVAILTLALGAGANALMFTIIDSVLLRPLPYPHADELVSIETATHRGSGSTSLPNFLDMRKQSRSFSGMVAYQEISSAIRLPDGQAIPGYGVTASTDFFKVLGIQPMLGTSFPADEDQSGKPCSVVVSAEFWREHLSGDPAALGRTLTMNGRTCSVSGIMPDGFSFPTLNDQFWIPLQPSPAAMSRGADAFSVLARLKSGVALDAARAELEAIARRLDKAYPDDNKDESFRAELYLNTITGDMKPALFALLGAVALLLLIACANIANLQLARALGRKREMAIRAAVGGSRLRIARQVFTENLLLSLIGTGAGIGLGSASLGLFKHLAANAIPRVQEIDLGPGVCVAMLALAVICALIFGMAPVWQAARQDIERALRESGTTVAGGRKQQRYRDLLVIAQLCLAIVLLSGSALLLHTLYHLLHLHRGFTTQHVLTMQTAVSGTEPANKNFATTVYGPELDRISQIPGVKAAGFVTFLPLSNGHASAGFFIQGRPKPTPQTQPHASLNAASEGYFRALRISLLRGRFFARTDVLNAPPVLIINDVLAKRYFRGQNPIGKQITFDDPYYNKHPLTIIGVVRGSRQMGLAKPPDAELYLDFHQIPPGTIWSQFFLKQIMTYVVRSTLSPATLIREVQHAIHRVDPMQTTFHVATMDEIVSDSVRSRRLDAILLSVFAGLALIVAAAGLYGLLSYTITQRTRDIAVRIALGAKQSDVVHMIVSRALILYAIGLCAGLIGAVWCGHLLSSMLAGVRPWDPASLGATAAILFLVVLFASWFPARRAAAINPREALRGE